MQYQRQPLVIVSMWLLASALTACGGGGSSGPGASSAPAAGTPASPAASSPGTPASTPVPAPVLVPAPASAPEPTLPAIDPAPTVSCAPGDSPQIRSSVFSFINLVRVTMGLPELARQPLVDLAAQAHAQYAVANKSTAVEETAGSACYTGADLTQRLSAVGAQTTDVMGLRQRSELVLAYEASAGEPQTWDYVNDTLNSLYGRMVMLDPRLQQIGIGASAEPGGAGRSMVIDTALLPGAVAATNNVWAAWPRDGAAGMPVRMTAMNMRPLDTVTEGYPISIHAGAPVQVTRFVLTTATDGQVVATALLTAANDRNRFLAEGEAALLPQAPLLAGTTYRVEFDGTVGMTALHRTWSFTTAR